MTIMNRFDQEILTGKICPYCFKQTSIVRADYHYNRPIKKGVFLRICFDCDASVGCHKKGKTSYGSLAKRKLRNLRQITHKYFDALWQFKMHKDDVKQPLARKLAYQWLANQLKIDINYCHIGYFDEDMCTRAKYLCKPFFINLQKKYKRKFNFLFY